MKIDSRVPEGNLFEKWDNYKNTCKLVSPANKRKFNIVIIGTGLAGAAAAASLGELGYNVSSFCFQDSPRRAHSIAAQGGINASKNYRNDNDSVYRLFYDTIKGGDFRAREANVYRLAQLSKNIIDHCVAQGVPFARDYGGFLDNRSFGGALVSRTFYARGQTGQQLLLGAYGALNRQISAGTVKSHPRTEMLDLVIHNGHAKGVVVRNLETGEIETHGGDAVVIASGGYSSVFYLSTNAISCNVSATFKAFKRGALFANPCYTQIHPTCIPQSGEHQSKLTLMSESLRNDGRVWVPRDKDEKRNSRNIPEEDRDYYLERKYPSYGNLAPRDIASRAAKQACDAGLGVGHGKKGVYLDFSEAIANFGESAISAKYGNLFHMYHKITGENPYNDPMRIYPAPHYTMGGLWVDYELMSNVPGLFVLGEANFSDHGANRLGASALMQGLVDGYFVIPNTISNYLSSVGSNSFDKNSQSFFEAKSKSKDYIDSLIGINGSRTPDSFHKELGAIMWQYCGMARNEGGLKKALSIIPGIRDEFWRNLQVLGDASSFNPMLERAVRVADFLEFAELICYDALTRNESCGGHFREEHQTLDGEARRDDVNFCHVSAWEHCDGALPKCHNEKLNFENVALQQRSYK